MNLKLRYITAGFVRLTTGVQGRYVRLRHWGIYTFFFRRQLLDRWFAQSGYTQGTRLIRALLSDVGEAKGDDKKTNREPSGRLGQE